MIYLPWIIVLVFVAFLASLVSWWLVLIPAPFLFALVAVRYTMRYAYPPDAK